MLENEGAMCNAIDERGDIYDATGERGANDRVEEICAILLMPRMLTMMIPMKGGGVVINTITLTLRGDT